MPVVETRIQHEYVMKFLCRREEEGGLGYRETDPNIVSPDLFIPSQLAEFVREANPIVWRSLMSRSHQDEIALQQALKEEVKSRLLDSSNAATFINKNRTITFEGETVPLFYVSGTELNGDTDFQKNIFAAVEEMPHNVVTDGITLMRIRPDVSFFVNGIYIGYMELKSVTNGQWAATRGRGKVISDYLEAVKGMADRERMHPDAVAVEHKNTLQIFEKAIHLVATDVNETYVLRGIAGYFEDVRKPFYRDRVEDYQKNQSPRQKWNSAAFKYAHGQLHKLLSDPASVAQLNAEYEAANHVASNGKSYTTLRAWKFNSLLHEYKQSHPFE